MTPAAPEPMEQPLDLRALAALRRDERVEVRAPPDRTLDAFEQTLKIIGPEAATDRAVSLADSRFAQELARAPRNSELRKLYIFAEALGGYDAVNELMREESPQFRMSVRYGETVIRRVLKEHELRLLEDYYQTLVRAIENAKQFFIETQLRQLELEERQELYALVNQAKQKTRQIIEILGKNLLLQMQHGVQRLFEIRQKILSVERTVYGVFLVDDEVMFIPAVELMEIINTLFKGVGNPYVARKADGVMLLAARNLLIEVISFYSYYGKHQIYQLFRRGQVVERRHVTMYIRNEVRKILRACKEDNRLVLSRIMEKEEERLDLSIEAIQREAEREAVEAVAEIFPLEPVAPPARPPRRTWFQRLMAWLGL